MDVRAPITAVATLVSASAQAADTDYVQNFCIRSERGGVSVQLSTNERATRTLEFASPPTGVLVFKGTTLSDMKWLAGYTDFKEFLYLRPKPESVVGLLVLVPKQGSSRRMGWLSPACWAMVKSVVQGAVPTMAKSGA